MIYADIDIDKLNHSASVISLDGKVLAEPFEFSHAFEGLRNFSLILVKYTQDELLIGFYSTAHYGNNLAKFLSGKGFRFCVLNPIQSSSTRKSIQM